MRLLTVCSVFGKLRSMSSEMEPEMEVVTVDKLNCSGSGLSLGVDGLEGEGEERDISLGLGRYAAAVVAGEEEEGNSSLLFRTIPCLACGSNCFVKYEEESSILPGTSLEGNECLVKFCQLLKVKINPKFNWEAGSEQIPICAHCKGQLILLSDLKRKLEELERDFRNGIREFRKLCEEAEGTFKNSGIYGKDQRYFKVRKQIVKMTSGSEIQPIARPKRIKTDKMVERKELPPLKLKSYALPYIRRPRRSESIRTKSISALAKYSPVVAVSADEKEVAEQFQIVKHESVEGNDMDHDYEDVDGFQMDLSPPPAGLDDKDPLEDDDWAASNLIHRGRQQQRKSKEDSPKNSKPMMKRKGKFGRKPKSKTSVSSSTSIKPPLKRKPDETEKEDDDDLLLDEDFSDFEDEMIKRGVWLRKTEEDDSDFEPDDKAKTRLSEPEESDMDDDALDAAEYLCEKQKEDRTIHDPQTGLYSILHVKFQRISEGNKILECLECHEKVCSITAMRSHAFRIHTTRFQCTVQGCGKCFGQPDTLKKHIDLVHKKLLKKGKKGQPRKPCPICGKPCDPGWVKVHMSTHYSEEDKAEALARGEKFRTWKDTGRTVQCDHCGKKCAGKYDLEQHILRKHPTPEDMETLKARKELCPECGKLIDKAHLAKHRLRSHNIGPDGKLLGEESAKRFICSVCDKRFAESKRLVKHKQAVHEKICPFKCDRCPRSFPFKDALNRHMDTHNNVRRFPCTHCPMAFFTGANLRRHCRIYHEEGGNPRRKSYVRGATTGNKKAKEAPLPHGQ